MASKSDNLQQKCQIFLEKGMYQEAREVFLQLDAEQLSGAMLNIYIVSSLRAGDPVASLRLIQDAPIVTPMLRRLELEALCNLRRHKEIVATLDDSFTRFRDNATDFAFYSLNELVFNRAFFEARYVLEHTCAIMDKFERGSVHDFKEKMKFISGTEESLSKILFDVNYNLRPVGRRLTNNERPTVGWTEVLCNKIDVQSSEIVGCFGLNTKDLMPANKSRFYADGNLNSYQLATLPKPKFTEGFLLRGACLTTVNDNVNLAMANGEVFPQLGTRNSVTNAGFSVTRRTFKHRKIDKVFLLPPIGDVGYFNAVLNGLFGILVWLNWFDDIPLAVPRGYSSVLIEYLNVMEIKDKDILFDASCEDVYFDVAFSFLNEGRSMSSDVLNLFQSLISSHVRPLVVAPAVGDLIYISRSRAQQRRLETEIEIETMLRTMGFSIVHFEAMSVQEQVSCLREARLIVAPHGAGLTNLVFASKLLVLCELIPDSYHVRGFENLALQLGAQYIGVIGKSLPSSTMAETSWAIDPSWLSQIVVELMNEIDAKASKLNTQV